MRQKGFALIFILLIVLFIIAATVGLYLYFKMSKNSATSISQTSCTFNLAPQLASSELLDKMVGHQNYQLEVNMKLTSSEINWTILRAGNKYTLNSKDIPDIIDYLDCDDVKNYSLIKSSNKYADLTNEDSSILSSGVGRPEYYFKSWPSNITTKGTDTLEGQKVRVYTAAANNLEHEAYVSAETGLPVKIVTKTTKDAVINLKFTRLNEVSESEVTIPTSAKGFTKEEMRQGEQIINRITKP